MKIKIVCILASLFLFSLVSCKQAKQSALSTKDNKIEEQKPNENIDKSIVYIKKITINKQWKKQRLQEI